MKVDKEDKPLSAGQVVTGQIVEGDQAYLPPSFEEVVDDSYYRDGYTLELEEGDSLFFDVASDFDVTLVLFGPDDHAIGEVGIQGEEMGRRIPAQFGETGTHRLVVMTSHPKGTGRYSVTYNKVEGAPPPLVQPAQIGDPPVSPDRQLSYGETLEGLLEPTDHAYMPNFMPRGSEDYYHDGFYFEGQIGERILVRVDGNFDCYLFLWSPDEVAVTQSMNFQEPERLEYTLESDGLHRIVLTTSGPSTKLPPDQGQYTISLIKLN